MKRFINIFWGILVGVALLLTATYGLLHVPFVQTQLVNLVTSFLYLGKGVDISVGEVEFVPIKSLNIKDLLVKDFKKDTLLYSRNLQLKIGKVDFVERDLRISEVRFDSAHFVVWRDADTTATSRTNIARLIDSLRGGPKVVDTLKLADIASGEQVKRWFVDLERVYVINSRFQYINSLYTARDYGINWTDIDCLNWSVELSNIHFGDTTNFTIDNFNFVEKSGIQFRNGSANINFATEHVWLDNIRFAFKESELYLKEISFAWEADTKAWSDYCKKINQRYVIEEPSYVNFRDIAYFNGILRGIENTVHVSGVVKNTIAELEGEDLRLGIDEDTRFQGKFKTVGLPDVSNTIFDIDIRNGYFSPYELSTIYLPWFKTKIPVPEPVKNFKMIRGDYLNFDGTFAEFDLSARTNTNGFKGDISMSMGRSMMNEIEINDFWGEFAMSQIDMGVLTGFDDLGEASVYGDFSGARDSLNIYTGVQTEWPYVELGDDRLENLSAYIMLDNNVNHIIAQTDDNGVYADIVMTIESEYNASQLTFDFTSATASLYIDSLQRFGYSIADSVESVGVGVKYLSAGTGKEKYNRLYISDLDYQNSRGEICIDTLLAEMQSNGERQEIIVNSRPISLYVEGRLNDIYERNLWNNFAAQYLPSLLPGLESSKRRNAGAIFNEFDFRAYLLGMHIDSIVQLLNPECYIENNTMIRADFTNRDSLALKIVSDSLRWGDIQAKACDMLLAGCADSLTLRLDAESIRYDTLVSMYNFRNISNLTEDRVSNRIFWGNWGEKSYTGDLRFDLDFARRDGLLASDMQLYDGVMVFEDSVWNVASSKVSLYNKTLNINNFNLTKGESHIRLDGELSESESKRLSIDVNEISLRRLSMFLPGEKRMLPFGNLSGLCEISNFTDNRYFEIGLQLDDWGIGRDTLGTLSVNSLWDAEGQQLILRGENQYDRKIPFSLYATYKPESDSLNMEVQLQTIRINKLNDYFGEYITGSSGGISGEVMCVGTLDNPQIFGAIYLDSVQMAINTLNTSFMINDNIKIEGSKVLFEDFVLHDVNMHNATINGYYQLFDNVYDVGCQIDAFTLMNTNSSYNDSFYGKLCVGGYAHADNLNGEINLALDCRTAGPSVLYLPLTSSLTDGANILTFVSPEESVDFVEDVDATFEGLNLDANVEVNDYLEVQLIFDPAIGDVLTCSGAGNLKFTIDNNDNIGMSGEYQVEEGDYLFTLGGIWNKKFLLEPGGTIVWNGTPYDATLNLSAEYNLRTSLYELYAATGSYDQNDNSEIRRKIPVQCKLTLTDRLTNPVIGLDIDFPTLDNQTKSYIRNLFATQDEINKQVFSLMVMNKFTMPDYIASSSLANQAGAAGITTLTELVSTKLSKWISKFSNSFDVGVTYRMGDEITSDELELALSTQLFNDRMTISANGNVNMNNSHVAENNTEPLAGDFDVDVKLNKQGTLHLKAYSHTDEKILYYSTETIQGIGLSYQEQFDTFKELLRKYTSFFKRKKSK
ncbi:MAG: translocation/assembly module TamB domain-containing protein [Marinifilaceae bacterium]|nr:translocation/assembly module TamB domain-containing protein [Marinifilaceae bacterium]